MAKVLPDITGLVFGRLTALKEVRTEKHSNGNIRHYWLCQCSCGNTKEILQTNLSTTKSCGCLRKELSSAPEWGGRFIKEGSAFRQCLANYKCGAAKRGLSWELTDEEFKEITSSPCYYTGVLPMNICTASSGEEYRYNGVDRLDNTKGYTINNCVPCCSEVNFMKKTLTYERFVKLCKTIAERV